MLKSSLDNTFFWSPCLMELFFSLTSSPHCLVEPAPLLPQGRSLTSSGSLHIPAASFDSKGTTTQWPNRKRLSWSFSGTAPAFGTVAHPCSTHFIVFPFLSISFPSFSGFAFFLLLSHQSMHIPKFTLCFSVLFSSFFSLGILFSFTISTLGTW